MGKIFNSAPPDTVTGTRDYYSIAQAAALLGVSRVSIWRWISAGRLPAARLGHRTIRIKRQDLERLLDEERACSRPSVSDGRGDGAASGDGAAVAPRADWRTLEAPEHFVQFYEADASLLDAVADYIGASLRAGDAGIVIATQPHREGVEARLRACGLDIGAARADGRYVALDAADVLASVMVDGAPEPGRFAEVVGGVIARAAERPRPVRAFGEMVALLAREGNHAAAVRLEELWNGLRQAHTFALFCAYPLQCLDGEALTGVLGDVCAAHTRVIPAESYTALPTADDRLRAIAVLQQQARTLEAALAAEGAARQRTGQLAAALETERDRLRLAVEAAALGTWDYYPPTGELRWSDRCKELFGLPPTAAVTYDVFLAGLHPEDRARTHAAVQRALDPASGGAYRTTYRTIGLEDGIERCVEAAGQAFFDAEGRPVRFIGTALDITERTRAEALRVRQARQAELRAEVGAALTQGGGIPAMLQQCAEALVRHLDAAFARTWTLNAATGMLELRASAGMYTHLDGAHSRVPVGAFKIGRIAAERTPHLTNDVQHDPRISDPAWARREGMVAFAGYPLIVEDRLIGVLALFARQPLSDDTLTTLASVAQMIATGIERKRAEALLSVQKQVLELIATGAALADVLIALIRAIEEQSEGMLCSILVRDRERERFNLGIAPSMPESYIGALANAPISPPYLGPCGRAAHLGEEVIVADVATDQRWADQWRHLALSHDLRTCYSSPIVASDGRILGSFGMYYREARDPKPSDAQVIETATHLAGIAIERSRTEAALREESETLEAINCIGRLLAAELDMETLVQAVTDAATALSGARFGAFFYNVIDQRGETYQLYTLAGARREDFAQFPLPRNTAIFGPTFRGEGVVRLEDVTQDPRYGLNAPYHGLPPGHLPVRSYLAVPVIARSGEVIGGIFLGHPQPGVFTERAEHLVVGLAAQAAIAMDNARLYQEAQRSIRARDEFLSAAAHDLQTPLTGIKGMAQLLRRRATRASAPEAQQLAEGLASIDQTATRLSELIDGLLDLTRMQLDRPLELDRQPTDLVALARQAVDVLQPTTTRHTLRVETDRAELVGLWDRARLARVLDNLLGNAIKYSPDGGPITVGIRQEPARDAAEAWAVLEVRDAGIGIPAAELPRVFDRFQRASNVIGRIAGTGIGLASARHIAESHGGTLTVGSQEGQGSTFTLRLPLATGRGPVQPPTGEAPRPG